MKIVDTSFKSIIQLKTKSKNVWKKKQNENIKENEATKILLTLITLWFPTRKYVPKNLASTLNNSYFCFSPSYIQSLKAHIVPSLIKVVNHQPQTHTHTCTNTHTHTHTHTHTNTQTYKQNLKVWVLRADWEKGQCNFYWYPKAKMLKLYKRLKLLQMLKTILWQIMIQSQKLRKLQ